RNAIPLYPFQLRLPMISDGDHCAPVFFRRELPATIYFMLIIRDLKITLGARTLFENASFQVNYGERVALVGPNGAGKSTLFSIILHTDDPDSGTVERDAWTMVGYLPQESAPLGDETVMDVATGRAGDLPALEKKLH